MKLHELADNPGATRPRKRVGRGPGSGLGKSSGRGIKGQNSRAGVAHNGFEGGQNPLYRRLPKRGFTNWPFFKRHAVINLGTLERFIAAGRIDPAQPVTEESLVASGVVRRRFDGIRLLATGELTRKLDIHVTGASAAAIAAVEKLGGTVTLPAPAPAEPAAG
jgi:large subunit ribosomal protein L15